jgi:FkbM family methyltransferase
VSYTVLLSNIVVNGLVDLFDLSAIGFGASDRSAGGFGMEVRKTNVGAAKMLAGNGDIEVRTGDEMLAHVAPTLIKIDVEGMENLVLAGLKETVAKHRPTMLVEVDNSSEAVFLKWVKSNRYEVLDTFIRYRSNKNYLIKAL